MEEYMSKYLLGIMIIGLVGFSGCESTPSSPSLPFEKYGSSPYGGWTFVNNSSQPIIVTFKNGLAFTVSKGAEKAITVKELIDSGCQLEDTEDPEYLSPLSYAGAPTQKRKFHYRYIVENGAKVSETWTKGVIIIIDNSGTAITAVKNAAQTITQSLPKDSKIAIVNISSNDSEQSEFVAGEIEVFLVNAGCNVVDRRELDKLRKEQNFQLSGDVDDNDIVSIGKFAGADIVLTGSISGTGSTRRLRIRVLNTQTARVIAAASEAY
jgi:hypothetical protein